MSGLITHPAAIWLAVAPMDMRRGIDGLSMLVQQALGHAPCSGSAFVFESLPLMTMYRAADALWKHSTQIEQTLFTRITDLFGFSTTITLYDLTNTYFEGEVPHNTKARHGRSKEKRTDCPLVTLGLVLDGSGFVRRSQTFAGNVSEASTLETMLHDLNAPLGALVVMDAGIATEANIQCCLLYTSDAADDLLCVDLGGRRIIK